MTKAGAYYEINGEMHPWSQEIAGFELENGLGPDDYIQKATYYQEDTGIFIEVIALDSIPPKFIVENGRKKTVHGSMVTALKEIPAALRVFKENAAALHAQMQDVAMQTGWEYSWVPGGLDMSFIKKIDKYGDYWLQIDIENPMDFFNGSCVHVEISKGIDQAYLGNSYRRLAQHALESKDQILTLLNDTCGKTL